MRGHSHGGPCSAPHGPLSLEKLKTYESFQFDEAWTEAHGVDIAPPATHWSAKEAEAHAAAKASAMAAAKAAAAPPLEPRDPMDSDSFMW